MPSILTLVRLAAIVLCCEWRTDQIRTGASNVSDQRPAQAGQPVQFLASIPPLQSALTISGDGGGRLKLDFDDSQTDAVLALLRWRGELLRVSVELAPVDSGRNR